MLEYSFSQIKNDRNPLVDIDEDISLRPPFFARSQGLLRKAKNVHVKGQFFYDEPFVTGNFTVTADVEVPSTRSLTPVAMHEEFNFTENYSEIKPTPEQLEDEETIIQVKDDKIDLQTAVEDNLLLNIPSVVLTKDEDENNIYPAGQGWKVVSEADHEKEAKEKVNPAFASLKQLLDKDDKN
ncbi:YceD family protein [Lactobacillus sp. PV034]|uniref:YceD family protein n=1 Tax=Lactobacillus sp. PV034 TaxID=2594495 RepID=UPI00223FDCB4|nr:YceD family protein [Lactobacillus sp. PV034]QNQ80139.1 DUF177 domain-containing protein [Lactobacillus sp. PV034]